jgi:signal transduction histidine kinase
VNRAERWLEHWSQPIHRGMYAGGRIEHHTDITQRKLIEAREREQAQKLAAAEERQRLARELHDSVTQTLFTSTVMAESALRQWGNDPAKSHNLLRQLHYLNTTALAEMRLLLLELRPASLMQQQLPALIQHLTTSLESRTGLHMTTDLDEGIQMPPDIKVALYRILQEALNNVTKHAQATAVHIGLKDYANRVELTIQDNGKGFDAQQIRPSSLGLSIMRERAEKIGALLEMNSQPEQGTTIQVIWPLPET